MKCERVRQLAKDIIWATQVDAPGENSDIAPDLAQHLRSCPDCRREFDELRALNAELRALGNRRAPSQLISRTMSAIRVERRRRRKARRLTPLYLRRALAAGVVAAAIAATGAYLAGQRPQSPAADTPVSATVAPLVMEYADFRGAQPFGDRDAMTLIRSHMEERQQP